MCITGFRTAGMEFLLQSKHLIYHSKINYHEKISDFVIVQPHNHLINQLSIAPYGCLQMLHLLYCILIKIISQILKPQLFLNKGCPNNYKYHSM
jgi:hypothetical protein